MAIPLKKTDLPFRNPRLFAVDTKNINLDHTLINLFMQIRYGGKRVRAMNFKTPTLEKLMERCRKLEADGIMSGVTGNEDAVMDWIRSDLANFVFRGNASKEKFSALAPRHLEAHRIIVLQVARDYFTADQVYAMLSTNPAALNGLKDYLAKDFDATPGVDKIAENSGLDLDSVAILHLIRGIKMDVRSTRRTETKGLQVLQDRSAVFCDDILRLLAYGDSMPREVLIGHLRTLVGLHLATFLLRLVRILPRMIVAGTTNIVDDWSLVVDASGRLKSAMSETACKDMELNLNGLGDYFRKALSVNFVQSFGDEYGNDIEKALGVAKKHSEGALFVAKRSLDELMQRFDDEDEREELLRRLEYEADDFDRYVAAVYCARSARLLKEHWRFIDSTGMKGTDSALIAGGRGKKTPRRAVIGPGLLELMIHLLTLEKAGGGYRSRALSVAELIRGIRDRYGLVIDGSGEARFAGADVAVQNAFSRNVSEFKRMLRETGFYTDLSDAGTLQRIHPRYEVK